MSFKKLKPEVVEALKSINIESLEDQSKQFFTAIKSGKNSWINSPAGTGKTTAASVAIFNRVNQEYEGSPRAIYMTDTIDKAEQVHKRFSLVCRKLDITTDLVHDKGNMVQQRNDIFDGTEIVVGNPKRIFDLYLQNGINLKLLEIVIIDEFELCIQQGRQAELKRLIESLEPKTQVVLLSNEATKKATAFVENLDIPFVFIDQDDSI